MNKKIWNVFLKTNDESDKEERKTNVVEVESSGVSFQNNPK